MMQIAGSAFFDGRPVSTGELDAMLCSTGSPCDLPAKTWVRGPVGLGASAASSRPVGLLASGEMVIAASARLDNLQELSDKLGLQGPVPDAAAILHAYISRGEDCLDDLRGDYAFVIWDSLRRRLFCARDRFGVKPFHYVMANSRFTFASDVVQLPSELKDTPREEAIADYLSGAVTDATSTFYSGLHRLPPAHCMTVEAGEVKVRRYWQLEPGEPGKGQDFPERFRALFEAAVRRRFPGDRSAGVLLSGGLDSSSIACVARNASSGVSVPAFSFVYENNPRLCEREYIDAVLAQGGFDPMLVNADGFAPFAGFDDLQAEQGGPFLAPNLACIRNVFQAARARGVSTLLDGHGGDEVVSHGFGYLDQLAREEKWGQLWALLRPAAATVGQGRAEVFLHFFRLVHRGRSGLITGPLLTALRKGRGTPLSVIEPEFLRRSGFRERQLASGMRHPRNARNEREYHLLTLTSPAQPYAFEVLHRLNSACGLEGRYPFWDQDLIEFCVSLPDEEKLSGDWSRLILRRAMAGTLPPKVAWRRDKIDFSQALLRGMIEHHSELVNSFCRRGSEVDGYVDCSRLSEMWRRLAANPASAGGSSILQLWRIVALGVWLRNRHNAGAHASLHKAA